MATRAAAAAVVAAAASQGAPIPAAPTGGGQAVPPVGGAGAAGGGGGGPGPPGGGGGAPPGAAAGAVALVPFALTPALISQQYLNYSLTADVKLYYKAIAPLSVKFDLTPANMRGFLQALYDKATDSNWLMTMTFVVRAIQFDLIKQYGSISLSDVRTYALTYTGTQSRHAQNSNQIYACLSESLTPEAKNKVALETSQFSINDVNDGLLYFKVIVGLAHIDTRATVTVIRTRLSSLDTKISEVQDNITDLNQYVKTQMDELGARGQRTDDLLVNLFKAYKACGDESFRLWIGTKEDLYNEGADLNPEELMSLAENKYRTLSESGHWMQKSSAQKRIVAMAAQIQTLEKGKSASVKKPDVKKPYLDKKGNGKDAGRFKKGKDKNSNWDWADKAPTADQPKEKDVDGKHFRWCTYHKEKGTGGKWVQHSLADCKLRIAQEAKGKAASTDAGAGKMKVAGMCTILADDVDF